MWVERRCQFRRSQQRRLPGSIYDHYYENVRGEKFVDRIDSFFPKTPWGSMGIKFFDFNHDGLRDLFVPEEAHETLFSHAVRAMLCHPFH